MFGGGANYLHFRKQQNTGLGRSTQVAKAVRVVSTILRGFVRLL